MTGDPKAARLLLVCHASTPATARAAFPRDESLDEQGLRRATALAGRLGPGWNGPDASQAPDGAGGGESGAAGPGGGPGGPGGPGALGGPGRPAGGRGPAVLRAPERRCLQTAQALGLRAGPDPLLADWDHGRWRGMTLAEVEAAEPMELAAWLSDPEAAPHGGESVLDLLGRVAGWLSAAAPGRTVAVTHPAVVRAAVVQVLDAPARSFWRVDAAPLARVALTGRGGHWRLVHPA
ncbi:hypothetical protein Ppa06_23620 [Planomonospora parontospora subsp. parontospora]|uniref:Phosphoglycerate mutase n=2 Tax=Planomonospora parontospora TaxID=58119 RepID=A0AA37BGC8_9ACTN|nr:histidine phosphatase family protein [Planomonospora parontospora]GGK66954.1 hypothetical protein GCM10010126_28030 [Planomonospora parontospora]GII08564.1 hypothetical protein Ppa06_23620 [Planomonospora parontospora subsp. parontospora]